MLMHSVGVKAVRCTKESLSSHSEQRDGRNSGDLIEVQCEAVARQLRLNTRAFK